MIERSTKSPAGAASPLIELVDPDRETLALVQEWLGEAGYRVIVGPPPAAGEKPALAIVDVPFTRHGCAEQLRQIAERHPGTPVLALSPTFFSNVRCDGDCARALGVAGVLPKPLTREALLGAVNRLLDPPQ